VEIGELVAVAVAAPHTKQGCPFCRPDEKVSHKNSLTAHYDEDTDADNNTENSSGTLAKNLGSHRQAKSVPAIPKGEDAPVMEMEMASAPKRTWHKQVYPAGLIPVLYGAHHLIPGNDAMAKSNVYINGWLGPVDDGVSDENIGYNINSAFNGFWLPGNYAVRPWKGLDPDFQEAYAFLAMKDAIRQFHDSHEPFSEFIRSELNGLEKLLKKIKNSGCPVCGSGSKKKEPPYHLNSRLNAISSHVKGYLTGPPTRWKDPAFTSGWSPLMKEFVSEEGGWPKACRKLERLRDSR